MEELEIEAVEEKAKYFRTSEFKPLGFFSKFFNNCYGILEVDKLLSKAIILKELAEDKIKDLKSKLKITEDKFRETSLELEEKNLNLYSLSSDKINLEKDLQSLKDKHKKELEKLTKTISDLQYSKCNLEKEVISLRTDLNECNKKFENKAKNNNKESGQFMDRLVKRNEKLETELKEIKEFLKKKKIKIEL